MINKHTLNKYCRILLLFIAMLSSFFSFGQQKLLKGTYTIGGINPDYTTIKKAAIELSNAKVTGPVIFNIRPGIYTETVKFMPYSGASAANEVVFRSETGNPADVVIQTAGAGFSFNHHAVQLNGVRHLTLRAITIINTGTAYASGIHFTKNAVRNTIDSCIIRTDSLSGGNSLAGIVSSGITNMYSAGQNASDNTISNNIISGGYYGIRLMGEETIHDLNNKVINNHITGCRYAGVYALFNDRLSVEKNYISLQKDLGDTRYGMAVHSSSGFINIAGNRVIDPGTFGLIMTRIADAGGSLVHNNMFGGGFDEQVSYGIYLDSVFGVGFYYNSIHQDAPLSDDNAAFYALQSKQLMLVNNILVASQGAYALYVRDTLTFDESDYNDYYSTGSSLAYIKNPVPDLSALKSATGSDEHSVSIDPQFVSGTDLHIRNVLLFEKGLYIESLPLDVEGEPRDDETPEPGADEIIRSNVDFKVAGIVGFVPVIGNNIFSVKLKNTGIYSLNDSSVSLSYSTNGGVTWSPAETFTPTKLQNTNNTETYTFTNPWVVSSRGTYNLCVRINPTGLVSDTFPGNNSFCKNICIGLKGLYTIGGVSPDFPDLSTAVNELMCGAGGDVTFNIRSGTYNERMSMGSVIRTSSSNRITFQSETGNPEDVIIGGQGGNTGTDHHIIQLKGAHNVQFRNISVTNNSTAYASGFHLTEGSDSIIISGCVISVNQNTSANTLVPVLASAASGMLLQGKNLSHSRIENNYLSGGDAGILLIGNGFYERDLNNSINGNKIDSSYNTGIYTRFNDLVSVSGNIITLRKSGGSNRTGIRISECRNNLRICDNRIGQVGKYGIHLNEVEGISQVLVSNNMVGAGFTVSSGNGIFGSDLDKVNFYHNSISYDGVQASAAAFYLSSGLNVRLLNNVFYNKGGGPAYRISDPESINLSDYNDLYSSGAVLASWNNTNQGSLAALQAATGGFESHSLTVDPMFVSDSDLHSLSQELDEKAFPLDEVKQDIDSMKRHPDAPDIGADEMILKDADLAVIDIRPSVLGFGNNPISVLLRNEGLASLNDSSVTLSYSSDNGATWSVPELFIPDSLGLPYDTELFTFAAPFNVSQKGTYSFCIRINTPGIVSDTALTNNQYCKDICVGLEAGIYTIGGVSPHYATIGAAIADITCGIAGPVTFKIRSGVYNERIIIPAIVNSSALNTVVITSETGQAEDVLIQSAGGGTYNDHHTLQLRSSSFVTLENLSIVNTHTEFASAVHLTKNACFNTIRNCIIQTDSTGLSTEVISIASADTDGVYSNNINASHNNISSNLIIGGYIGVQFTGSSPVIHDTGNEITGNIFQSPYRIGVSTKYTDVSEISFNKIYMHLGRPDGIGINVVNAKSDLRIRNNYSANTGNAGFYLDKVSSPNGALIYNNMIAGGFSAPSGGSGISIVSSNNLNFYFNSVNFDGNSATGSALRISGNTKRIRLMNNNFSSTKAGYAYSVITPAAIVLSDHNNLFTAGSKLVLWSSTQISDLATYTNSTFKDSNSVSANPVYNSTYDLHLLNPFLNGRAKPLSGIAQDYDGDTRSLLKPDIGADEFIVVEDLGVTAFQNPLNGSTIDAYQQISVTVKNFGNVNMSGFKIGFSIDGEDPVWETANGTVAPNGSMTYTFDSIFSPIYTAPYQLCAFTAVTEDFDIDNDSSCIHIYSTVADTIDGGVTAFISPADNDVLNGPVPVKVRVSNFGNKTLKNYAIELTVDGGIVHSQSIADSLLPDSSAIITLSYSLSPSFGYHDIQAYTIAPNDRDYLNDTASIGVTMLTGIETQPGPDFILNKLYPNPSAGTVFLDIRFLKPLKLSIVLSDLPGNKLIEQVYELKDASEQKLELDLSKFPAGLYLLHIDTGDQRFVRKVVISD